VTSLPRKLVSAAVTMLMVAAATALLGLGALIIAGYKPQVVKSGSMRPMLERGSLVFVKPTPAAQLRAGDVITFQNPIKGGKELVTHRIVAVKNTEQGLVFETKGDANVTRDPWMVKMDADAGLLKFDVPYVGQLSFLVHSRNGYIVLFALPLALLAMIALWRIWFAAPAGPKSAKDDDDPLAIYRERLGEASNA
jgi:signal peptidase